MLTEAAEEALGIPKNRRENRRNKRETQRDNQDKDSDSSSDSSDSSKCKLYDYFKLPQMMIVDPVTDIFFLVFTSFL